MEIKNVNINDIEELVLTKHEIETYLIDKGIINEKISIDKFINDYAMIKYIYAESEDNLIPFGLAKYANIIYIFNVNNNENDIKSVNNKLKSINYDINNVIEVGYDDIANHPDEPYLVFNGTFYK